MSNSRSQTKIRKTQQVNLIAEQRYLKQKSLLVESTDDFINCFDMLGYSSDMIPGPCQQIETKENFLNCRTYVMNSLSKNITTTPTNVYDTFFNCMTTKATELGLFLNEEPPSEEELPSEEEPEEEK